jgi:hypothetical protein
MARLLVLLALADLVITLLALIDCLSVEEPEIRALPRIIWVFIILLFPSVGGIAWFVAGRPVPVTQAMSSWRGPSAGGGRQPIDPEHPAGRSRPIGPEDDPDLIAGPTAPQDAQPPANVDEDLALLRAWEADLRRREAALREREKGLETGDN